VDHCVELRTALMGMVFQSNAAPRDTVLLPPIYSRRKRQTEAAGQDVYNHISIPVRVRVQVKQMLETGLGLASKDSFRGSSVNPYYEHIVKLMRIELGVDQLSGNMHHDFQQELFGWLQQEPNTDHWLDGVEVSLQGIKRGMTDHNSVIFIIQLQKLMT
jgi:hypothetical protein